MSYGHRVCRSGVRSSYRTHCSPARLHHFSSSGRSDGSFDRECLGGCSISRSGAADLSGRSLHS